MWSVVGIVLVGWFLGVMSAVLFALAFPRRWAKVLKEVGEEVHQWLAVANRQWADLLKEARGEWTGLLNEMRDELSALRSLRQDLDSVVERLDHSDDDREVEGHGI